MSKTNILFLGNCQAAYLSSWYNNYDDSYKCVKIANFQNKQQLLNLEFDFFQAVGMDDPRVGEEVHGPHGTGIARREVGFISLFNSGGKGLELMNQIISNVDVVVCQHHSLVHANLPQYMKDTPGVKWYVIPNIRVPQPRVPEWTYKWWRFVRKWCDGCPDEARKLLINGPVPDELLQFLRKQIDNSYLVSNGFDQRVVDTYSNIPNVTVVAPHIHTYLRTIEQDRLLAVTTNHPTLFYFTYIAHKLGEAGLPLNWHQLISSDNWNQLVMVPPRSSNPVPTITSVWKKLYPKLRQISEIDRKQYDTSAESINNWFSQLSHIEYYLNGNEI